MNMQKAAQFFGSCRDFLARHKIVLIFAAIGVTFGAFQIAQAVTATELMNAGNPMNLLMVFIGIVLQALAWAVGKLIVLLIGMVIIPILGYNNFGNSHIIDIGWPLVRDVVNMFFIIILLVLAIQTILGMSRAKVQENLPKFFIAVLAVNFSRLISLLMIDAGQVVMFTFVNALRDIAAGNFVGLFQLNSFMGVSGEQATAALTTGGLSAFGFLGSAYVTLSLLLGVLAVLIVMAVVFIYRIVVLWVLVIMSPAAFFMIMLKGMGIGTGAGRYDEWWKKMVSAITLGPILTFFLWLGLAAASNGSLAAVERFPDAPTADSEASAGIYTEVFQMEQLLSLLIGLILISTGFQVASSAAEGIGGVAAQAFGSQGLFTQDSFFKGALGAPATIAGRGARAGARGAYTAGSYAARGAYAGGAYAAEQLERRTGAFSKLGSGITSGARELGARGGISGKLAGTIAAGVGGAISTRAGAFAKEKREAAQKRNQDRTVGERVARMSLSDPETSRALSLSQDRRDEFEEDHRSFATDSGFRKQVKSEFESQFGGDKDKVNQAMAEFTRQSLSMVGSAELEGSMSPDEKKKFAKFKVGNLDALMEGKSDDEQKKIAKDLINDNDEFNPRDLSAAGVANKHVQDALAAIPQKTDENGNVIETSLSNAILGKGVNTDVRDALRGKDANFGESGAPIIAAGLKYNNPDRPGEKNLNIANLTIQDMSDPTQAAAVARGALDSNADLSRAGDASANPAQVKDELISQIDAIKASAGTDEVGKRNADRAIFNISGNLTDIGVGTSGARTGAIAPDMNITVREEIKARPESLKHFAQVAESAANGGVSNDVTKAIVDSVDAKYLDSMLENYSKATTAEVQTDLKTALKAIQESITAEFDNDDRNADALDKLEAKAKLIERQMN